MPSPTPSSDKRETPAMAQYERFKQRHPDCVLFFRMGDFYEMFHEDALLCNRVLGITLTQRSEGVPMAGVPYHSVESYLRKMIDAGHRVAVCDQIQDAREAKGVVERAVTRVLTPGTLVDEALLSDDRPSTLAAIAFLESGDAPETHCAIATIELSTGAFYLATVNAREAIDEISRRGVSELIYADAGIEGPPPRIKRLLEALSISGVARPGWHFRRAEAMESLTQQFNVSTLAGFGIADEDPAIIAAGTIVRYLRDTQSLDLSDTATSEGFSSGSANAMMLRKRSLAHLQPPKREEPTDALVLDATTLRALEIEKTVRGNDPEGSLLGVFLKGKHAPATPMGRRLLRDWLVRPASDLGVINARLGAVALLVEDRRTASALAASLDGVQDVARISARVTLGRATPRDLSALGRSTARIGAIMDALQGAPAVASLHAALASVRDALQPLADRIGATCVDDPPAHLREGGLVRDGVDAELDDSRELQNESHQWLARYQQKIVEQYDLPSLKSGYNKVFGYYLELPAAQARRAPTEFTRKQTLKNAERYITPELKEFEEKVLTAGERAIQREQAIFLELCDAAAALVRELASFAETVAQLDVLRCFADKAASRRWVRPTITDDATLDIRQGRHPVLDEKLIGNDGFVPNDALLGVPEENADHAPRLALITGPNMAGKSTFIRQVALLVILAHAGSFVPADSAAIGLTDRVFARVGADDALHQGQSTFMVEMIETANILHHATQRSLIVLDEIGRGTSTLDGLSLAWAIAEHLAQSPPAPAPRTLFATHYHEITDLADRSPESIKNLHVAVREWGEEIVFLHRILPGRASRSYGIHVAKLAGLPASAVKRAESLLDSLTVSHGTLGDEVKKAADKAPKRNDQMGLFTEYLPHPVIAELKNIDLNQLTPMQAFDALRELASRLDESR
ncbi:MAG: DNA mismatch repair protein MutS [Phycisphaerales bacterium]|nr:DNA mismatch repair protein MutS [Phycisphaerales bacterium]